MITFALPRTASDYFRVQSTHVQNRKEKRKMAVTETPRCDFKAGRKRRRTTVYESTVEDSESRDSSPQRPQSPPADLQLINTHNDPFLVALGSSFLAKDSKIMLQREDLAFLNDCVKPFESQEALFGDHLGLCDSQLDPEVGKCDSQVRRENSVFTEMASENNTVFTLNTAARPDKNDISSSDDQLTNSSNSSDEYSQSIKFKSSTELNSRPFGLKSIAETNLQRSTFKLDDFDADLQIGSTSPVRISTRALKVDPPLPIVPQFPLQKIIDPQISNTLKESAQIRYISPSKISPYQSKFTHLNPIQTVTPQDYQMPSECEFGARNITRLIKEMNVTQLAAVLVGMSSVQNLPNQNNGLLLTGASKSAVLDVCEMNECDKIRLGWLCGNQWK